MEEELRYAPLTFRNPMMSKLRNYRKDLAKLHREVRSTPLTATPGGRGDLKFGTYTLENEHLVSVSYSSLRACGTRTRQFMLSMYTESQVFVFLPLTSFLHLVTVLPSGCCSF